MDSVGELLQLIEQLSTSAASGEHVDLGRFQRLSRLYHEAGKRTAKARSSRQGSHVSDEQLAQSFRVLQASLTQMHGVGAEEHVPQLLVQVDKLVDHVQDGAHAEAALPLLLTMDLMSVLFAQWQSALQSSQLSAADEYLQRQQLSNELEMQKLVEAANGRAEDWKEAARTCKAQYLQLEKLYKEECTRGVDVAADLTAANQNVQGLQRAIDIHLNTIETLNEQLQAALARLDSGTTAQARLDNLKEANKVQEIEWKKQFELADAKLEAVAVELDDQMASNKQLEQQLDALQQKHAGCESVLATKENELQAVHKKLLEAQADFAHEKGCLESRVRALEIERVKEDNKAADETAKALQTTLTAELQDLRLELNGERAALQQRQDDLDANATILEEKQREITALQQTNTTMEAELRALTNDLEQSQQAKSVSVQHADDVSAELDKRSEELRTTKITLENAQLEIQRLQLEVLSQADETSSRLAEITAENQQYAQRVKELEAELQRQATDSNELLQLKQQQFGRDRDSEIHSLKAAHKQALQRERTEASARTAKLEDDVARLTKQLGAKTQQALRYEQEGHLTVEQQKELQQFVIAALACCGTPQIAEQQRTTCRVSAFQIAAWSGISLELLNEPVTATGDGEDGETEGNSTDHALSIDNAIFVEMGTFQIRVALCSVASGLGQIEKCYSIQAVPVQGREAVELVASASIKADKMFKFFRENGKFVGNDAWRCCFEHPDPALRGSLRIEQVFVDNEAQDQNTLLQMFQQLLADRAQDALVVVALHAGVSMKFKSCILEVMLEHLYASHCCLLSQPALVLSGLGLVTGVFVNIGSDATTVVAVYEGFAISDSLCVTRVGGEMLTRYMALLIAGKHVHNFSHLLPRRQEYIARMMKERSCFVAADFGVAIATYGTVAFEEKATLLVEKCASEGTLPFAEQTDEETKRKLEHIRFDFEEPLSDGTVIQVTMDRERFHCPELLFKPQMFEKTRTEVGLIELIQQCISSIDLSCVNEISENIVLSGATCQLPGLVERVQKDLGNKYQVKLAECNEELPTAVCKGMARRLQQMQHSQKGIAEQLENVISYDSFSEKGIAVLDGLL